MDGAKLGLIQTCPLHLALPGASSHSSVPLPNGFLRVRMEYASTVMATKLSFGMGKHSLYIRCGADV